MGAGAPLLSPLSPGPAWQNRSRGQGPGAAGQPPGGRKTAVHAATGPQLRSSGLGRLKKETLPDSAGEREAPQALAGPEAGDAEDGQPPPSLPGRVAARAAELSLTAGLPPRSPWPWRRQEPSAAAAGEGQRHRAWRGQGREQTPRVPAVPPTQAGPASGEHPKPHGQVLPRGVAGVGWPVGAPADSGAAEPSPLSPGQPAGALGPTLASVLRSSPGWPGSRPRRNKASS